jgi:hypothetical protein
MINAEKFQKWFELPKADLAALAGEGHSTAALNRQVSPSLNFRWLLRGNRSWLPTQSTWSLPS